MLRHDVTVNGEHLLRPGQKRTEAFRVPIDGGEKEIVGSFDIRHWGVWHTEGIRPWRDGDGLLRAPDDRHREP